MTAETIPTDMAFDPYVLRAEFPILAREVNGKPLVYLDNAASAQKPDAVIDAVANVWRTSYANVHRGLHTLANEATAAFEGARAKAELLMAEIPALRQAAGDPDTPLSMSIGIAESDPETPRPPDILADAADRALYAAKRQGRSRIALANFSEDNAA